MADLPDGEATPRDGTLPASALADVAHRPFSVYLHIPFCRVRCGYCDFNTYTNAELGGGADMRNYATTALAEIELAGKRMRDAGQSPPPVSTIFFGGGTPTMLDPTDLARMLDAVRDTWGLSDGVEITTEANPDSVDASDLQTLADAGFTRVSIGMQSAVPHVLATLDRTHDPANVPGVVQAAKDTGLEVSLDLIYGTPGESAGDWQASLSAALAMDPDHISAYALVVERGTKMGAQVRRGELPLPSDDEAADRYLVLEDAMTGAGYSWYEISNFARISAGDDVAAGHMRYACRHNVAYWRGANWWGIGPGAHSHVGGVRWWNAKHPRAYADRLSSGASPAIGREILDAEALDLERVMLGLRLAEGLDVSAESDAGLRTHLGALVADGLADPEFAEQGRVRLTLSGRLLEDTVVRILSS